MEAKTVRVYEMAKQLGVDNKDLVKWLQKRGYSVKSHSSGLAEHEGKEAILAYQAEQAKSTQQQQATARAASRVIIRRQGAAAPCAAPEAEPEPEVVPPPAAEVTEAAGPEPEPPEPSAHAAPDSEPPPGEAPPPAVAEEAPEPSVSKPVPGEEDDPAQRKAPTMTRAVLISKPATPMQPIRPSSGFGPPSTGLRRRPTGTGPVSPVAAPAAPATDASRKGRREYTRHDLYDMRERRPGGGTIAGGGRRTRGRPGPSLPGKQRPREAEIPAAKQGRRVIRVEDTISVADLAHRMGVKGGVLVKKLFDMGSMVTLNQVLDLDTATIIASEFGYEIENVAHSEESFLEGAGPKPENLAKRPPVVTIMGHVDHGKTTLLDTIRKADVASGEAGGITQHIGAYFVETPRGVITFLDTPGHEAFTKMRARGAKVTDIVVLVVAADDGVRPQTIEAIHHAKAAGVPIVVAVNKVDKPGIDIDRVKRELTEQQLVPEEWGGDTMMVPVSAKKGQGIPELLESILLQADVLELKADATAQATGTVIEARLDKGRGPVATVLITAGTLGQGDTVVAGTHSGRARSLLDHNGRMLKSAGPAIPVEVLGLSGVPEAGDDFNAVASDKRARELADFRAQRRRNAELSASARASLDDLFAKIKEGDAEELKVVVKADVQGSIEAIEQALNKLGTEKVRVRVLHSGVGAITEGDVMLASASKAVILGFHVRPDSQGRIAAEREHIAIKIYNIIYDLIDDAKIMMTGLLPMTVKENLIGRVDVRNLFHAPKVGTVAGCYVTEGKVTRAATVRLIRDSVQIFEGKLASLRRFKDDVGEVREGLECGLSLEGYQDVKVGDVVEAYEIEHVRGEL